MNGGDEDDKPTVVLDLNALKKQKLKQEEDLANIVQEIEFDVLAKPESTPAPQKRAAPKLEDDFTESKLPPKQAAPGLPKDKKPQFTIILFDLQSDFFAKAKASFPQGYNYKVISTLPELNTLLRSKDFQIAVFNYDVNPKAVNQLCAQIKLKFPSTKTIIMAKAISPEKAKVHAKTPSGASGYYQFPLDAAKIEKEILKIYQTEKKVG